MLSFHVFASFRQTELAPKCGQVSESPQHSWDNISIGILERIIIINKVLYFFPEIND